MVDKVSRLSRGNRVNERLSATEWPLDDPFYCLTNSLCLRHLTAQRGKETPLGRRVKRGRQNRGEKRRLNSGGE